MINYIIGYLVLGTSILLMINVISRMDNSQEAKDRRRLFGLMDRPPTSWQGKLLVQIIVPVIAGIFAISFWPVVVVWVAIDRLSKRAYKNRSKPESEVFEVKKDHLIEQVSIEHIESQEMLIDPLGAVPDIPFGHLNSAWLEFKEKIRENEKIWTFSANWTSEWGHKEFYTGYVSVKLDIPAEYFITQIKYQ